MNLIDILTNSPQYFFWKHIGTRNENLNFDGFMCNNSSGERLLADGCSRVPFSPFIDLRWWWTCKLSFVSVTRPCLLFCSHTIRTELAHISEKSTVILEKYYNSIKHEKRDKPTGTRWVGWSLCYSSCFKFFLKYIQQICWKNERTVSTINTTVHADLNKRLD